MRAIALPLMLAVVATACGDSGVSAKLQPLSATTASTAPAAAALTPQPREPHVIHIDHDRNTIRCPATLPAERTVCTTVRTMPWLLTQQEISKAQQKRVWQLVTDLAGIKPGGAFNFVCVGNEDTALALDDRPAIAVGCTDPRSVLLDMVENPPASAQTTG